MAGWDATTGPSVFTIPSGGGLFRQPWAIGGKGNSPSASKNMLRISSDLGSGSTYVYGYCDATFKEGWGRNETVEFVKNSGILRLSISEI